MSAHKKRAELREKCENPKNFTCGKCKRVVPFNDGYACPHCDEDDDEEEAV
jgi:RNA polymerase subunit RPABC4/transcription elongation factor Spt4